MRAAPACADDFHAVSDRVVDGLDRGRIVACAGVVAVGVVIEKFQSHDSNVSADTTNADRVVGNRAHVTRAMRAVARVRQILVLRLARSAGFVFQASRHVEVSDVERLVNVVSKVIADELGIARVAPHRADQIFVVVVHAGIDHGSGQRLLARLHRLNCFNRRHIDAVQSPVFRSQRIHARSDVSARKLDFRNGSVESAEEVSVHERKAQEGRAFFRVLSLEMNRQVIEEVRSHALDQA